VSVMGTPLGWEVSLCTEDGVVETLKRRVGSAVGVDAGVAVSFATSDGEFHRVLYPGPGERECRLRLECRLARHRKGSRRRERTKRQSARVGPWAGGLAADRRGRDRPPDVLTGREELHVHDPQRVSLLSTVE